MKISKQLLTISQETRSVPLRKNYGGEQTLCECLFTVAGKSTVAIMTMGKTIWTMKKTGSSSALCFVYNFMRYSSLGHMKVYLLEPEEKPERP